MRTSIAILAAIALVGASIPAHAAGRCKAPFVSTGNMKLTKYGALKSAREVWAAQVRAQHGIEFAAWKKARAKSSTCTKTGAVFNYTCKVRARPCR